ncbi:L,D-transpeptidase [Massilia sp. KIM]|uniref:L,D-transpeptidase family protein n=1 Tax=Massilia sp. KIM TaxID=1955422 RepID=UPI00098E9440|nr:L,D-transpeptidase family protein [Massilia sp. KIM]OON60775.1 L,D-transpeptidase [Massilia sp. KIM]
MHPGWLLLTAGLAASLAAGPAAAQGAKTSSAVELARQAERLKPGQWLWAPQIAPRGPMLVFVDLSTQRATVYRNGVRIGVSTVSTGKPGHETPTGVFTILQKDARHRSSTYNNAPMPFQQRLTWDGVALHAGGLPGYPESHGCVHLPFAFARALFEATSHATTVVIAGDAAHPVATGGGEVLAPALARDAEAEAEAAAAAPQAEFWEPARSPAGPVTIVMSRSDQAVSVLRNGIEIGRGQAINTSSDDSTHVLMLGSGKDGEPVWIYAGVSGHEDEQGRVLDEATRNLVRIAPDFYARVAPLLTPGTTLLVTQASLSAGSVGQRLTVLSGAR